MRTLFFLATLALTGCMAAGVKVQDTQLQQLEPGRTTYAQVLATLGTPTRATQDHTGARQLQYVSTKTELNAASFIPIANVLAGTTRVDTTTVTLQFDPHDTLTGYTTTQGTSEAGGLLTGGR